MMDEGYDWGGERSTVQAEGKCLVYLRLRSAAAAESEALSALLTRTKLGGDQEKVEKVAADP